MSSALLLWTLRLLLEWAEAQCAHFQSARRTKSDRRKVDAPLFVLVCNWRGGGEHGAHKLTARHVLVREWAAAVSRDTSIYTRAFE